MTDPLQPRQFEQLPMFMSGREMTNLQAGKGDKEVLDTLYGSWAETSDEVFDRKRMEATAGNLDKSIQRDGVKTPIEITHERGEEGRKQVLDGHHRAAVAMEDPDRLVPVLHHETEVDAVNPDFWRAYPNLHGTVQRRTASS